MLGVYEWPAVAPPTLDGPVISTLSPHSLFGNHLGGLTPTVYASGTYAAANRAMYYPFRVWTTYVSAVIWWINGATVSGNVDAGVYSSEGNRLASTSSTAQAGINLAQSVALVVTISPGMLYYFAIACDNTTATFMRDQPSPIQTRSVGHLQQATAFPLPATATFAQSATNQVVAMGLSSQSVV